MASESRRPGAPSSTKVDAGQAPADLTGAVVSGVLWKSLTRGVAETTRVVVVLVLARLLTPEEYGIAGMALVVASFGVILTDPALGAALVQRPTIDERDRSTIFWLAVPIGAGLTILGISTSGLVADAFGEPQVQELFAVASLSFVVVGLAVVPRALLTRRLAYRSLELREMAGVLAGGATAIAVAVAGFGPWAFVASLLVNVTVATALAWLFAGWRPHRMFSVVSARSLGGFSARIFGAMLLNWGNQNVDKVLVGRFLGASSLGAYSIAWNVMRMPVTLVTATIQQALTPAYSRIQQEHERLERAWLRNKRLTYSLIAPALAAVVVVAPDLVPVAFGDQWDDVVLPLQLLCLGALASSFGALNWGVLQARGEGTTLLRLTLLTSSVTWAAFIAGLPWGIVGVAAFYAGARWLLVLPVTLITTRGVGFDFWATLRAGAEVLPVVAAAGLLAAGTRVVLLETDLPIGVRLVATTLVFVVSYLALMLAFLRGVVRDLRGVVAGRRSNRRGAAVRPTGPPAA